MKIGSKVLLSAVLIGLVMFISACGEKPLDVDTAPFEKSITTFLAAKQMDMKVNKFKAIKIEGDTANATCSMKSQTGIGPAVVWKFTFKKENNAWSVSNLKQ
jgi:hypothetical protein